MLLLQSHMTGAYTEGMKGVGMSVNLSVGVRS